MIGVEIAAVIFSSTLAAGSGFSLAPRAEQRNDSRPPGLRVASGICPQNRKTRSAPSRYLKKTNPLPASAENLKAGERLYHRNAKPTACRMCHGILGNGNGKLAPGLAPPPRNFTCKETMQEIADGQMFWIIRNGSKSTAMPPHKSTLSEKQIWQLIHYIRKFQR